MINLMNFCKDLRNPHHLLSYQYKLALQEFCIFFKKNLKLMLNKHKVI